MYSDPVLVKPGSGMVGEIFWRSLGVIPLKSPFQGLSGGITMLESHFWPRMAIFGPEWPFLVGLSITFTFLWLTFHHFHGPWCWCWPLHGWCIIHHHHWNFFLPGIHSGIHEKVFQGKKNSKKIQKVPHSLKIPIFGLKMAFFGSKMGISPHWW